jgi:hypothetical protein
MLRTFQLVFFGQCGANQSDSRFGVERISTSIASGRAGSGNCGVERSRLEFPAAPGSQATESMVA